MVWLSALAGAVALVVTYKYRSRDQSEASQVWLAIKKTEWELDCLVDWYWGAILSLPTLEISKDAIRAQFREEKENLIQQKRRLEKKLHDLELKG